MSLGPMSYPGNDPFLRKGGMGLSSVNEIFKKPLGSGGGGIVRKKPANAEVAAEEPEPIHQEPVKEEKPAPQAKLFNLKWGSETGYFEEKIKISVEAELPESLKGITRVVITLQNAGPGGKNTDIKSYDGYLSNGLAEVEVELPHTKGKDATTEAERTFLCTAKHRDSKVLESAPLKAKVRKSGPGDLALELENGAEFKKRSFVFRLKQADGKVTGTLESKEIKEIEGKATLTFHDLKPEVSYTLELLNDKGGVMEVIFENREFGKWK
jgi:hypothetical protein